MYVVLLVSMPTYIYLITGMSQVMLSIECIIKYKNVSIEESEEMDFAAKRSKTKLNEKILNLTYIGILIFSCCVIVGFIIV